MATVNRAWLCFNKDTGAAVWEEIALLTSTGVVELGKGGTGADLSATGPGFLKQASAGAAVTVGAIAASDLPAGIDAAKLADGSVSNAELQFLGTVTSNVQTQLDGKQRKLVTHATNAPGVNDDTGAGYVAFESLWWEQDARVLWICIDHTAGAADWAGVAFPL